MQFTALETTVAYPGKPAGATHPAAVVRAALPVADHPRVLVDDTLGVPGHVFAEHDRRRRPQLQTGFGKGANEQVRSMLQAGVRSP